MRRKFGLAISLLIILLSFSVAVLADTIHLKDGTTVKGKVVGFKDQQFIILVGDGARGRRSEMRLYPEDIDFIEFDGNSIVVPNNTANTGTTTTTIPVSTSNNNTSTASTGSNSRSNDNGDDDSAPIVVGKNSNSSSSTGNSRPSNSSSGSITQVINSRPPVSSSSSSSSNPNSGSGNPVVIGNSTNNSSTVSTAPVNPTVSTAPVSSSSASTISKGKPVNLKLKVLADNTANGWTNAGIVVKKGQRLRISSNGRISLGNGRFATPAGVASLPDKDKLMQSEPTGSLIAVIGDNNNDFIFIGNSREFIAQRDGILFLGVNEGNLNDNSGAFETSVEVEDVK